MINETIKDTGRRMQRSIDALTAELSRIRTGRANPDLLEHIRVAYYGSEVPLNNAANITIEDSRTLTVTAFEKDMVQSIEKAILASDLGVTPNSAGIVIRIPLPALTEERRRDLVKAVKAEAESARVAVRNIRRDANGDLKGMGKEKMISEDDERRAGNHVQKLTDDNIARIEAIVNEKEKELLEI